MANEYKGISAIMPVPFSKDAGTVADTAIDLPYAGGIEADTPSATQGFVMLFDGCVVGMSACRTTGHATYDVVCKLNKGATLVSGATLTFTKSTAAEGKTAHVRWMPGVYEFAAGEVVNVEIIGSATGYDAGNVTVVVFVQVGCSQS